MSGCDFASVVGKDLGALYYGVPPFWCDDSSGPIPPTPVPVTWGELATKLVTWGALTAKNVTWQQLKEGVIL